MTLSTVPLTTVRFLALVLFGSVSMTAAAAPDALPPHQNFALMPIQVAALKSIGFCTVSASTETYNHFYGGSTHSERGSIVCENDVALYLGGEVGTRDSGNRTDAILANLVGQMQSLGFKVVACENNGARPACRLTRSAATCSSD